MFFFFFIDERYLPEVLATTNHFLAAKETELTFQKNDTITILAYLSPTVFKVNLSSYF